MTFAIVLTPLALIVVFGLPGCAGSQSPEHPNLSKSIGAIEREFGISLVLGPSYRRRYDRWGRPFTATMPPKAAVASYADLLAEELLRISPTLLTCAGLKRVALVSKLRVGRHDRGAFPDFEASTLVLDVSIYRTDPDFERWLIHHEFFHMLDFARNELIRSDEDWASFNPPGFDGYGPGGDRVWHDPETAYSRDSPPPGFASLYATMGAEEDKAETFAAMMTMPSGRVHADPAVRHKVDYLRDRIASFCPEAS